MSVVPSQFDRLAFRFTQASIYSVGMLAREVDVFGSDIFKHFQALRGFDEKKFAEWAGLVFQSADDSKLFASIHKDSFEYFKNKITKDPKSISHLCRECKEIERYVLKTKLSRRESF